MDVAPRGGFRQQRQGLRPWEGHRHVPHRLWLRLWDVRIVGWGELTCGHWPLARLDLWGYRCMGGGILLGEVVPQRPTVWLARDAKLGSSAASRPQKCVKEPSRDLLGPGPPPPCFDPHPQLQNHKE